MRPIAALALIALVLGVSLSSLCTPSFAQITPAITITASRPPVFLPVVIRAASTIMPTITKTPSATATITRSPTSQIVTPPPGHYQHTAHRRNQHTEFATAQLQQLPG